MADGGLAKAQTAWDAWSRSRDGAKAQVAAVLKMRRGYDLGAIDLADLLFAERQTQEMFRLEAQARTDALRAITRLRIDSHELWIGDDLERGEKQSESHCGHCTCQLKRSKDLVQGFPESEGVASQVIRTICQSVQ
jgi:hypothetical protein